MKVIFTKMLALGGLCALIATAGSAVSAQGFSHRDGTFPPRRVGYGTAHQRIQKLQRVYARSVHTGNTAAARRAHWRAQAIRERLRARRHGSTYRSAPWSETSW